jgi:arylsulfatase
MLLLVKHGLSGTPFRLRREVHLDGDNITAALAGNTLSPRKEFFYFNDDGSLVALRYNQ